MLVLDWLAHLLLPASCELCGAALVPESGRLRLPVRVCTPCLARQLQLAQAPAWRLEGLPVLAPFWYEEPVSDWIREIKQGGREAWLDRLADCWPCTPLLREPGVSLVPVPAEARRRRERGGDHVERLACRWSRRWGVGCRRLLRRKGGSHQVGLGAQERRRNLDGQYQLRTGPQPHGALWLVDDVVTTGATLSACADRLSEGGWTVRGALALALTPHPGLRGRSLESLQAWVDGSP